jgi:hypothetical protein
MNAENTSCRLELRWGTLRVSPVLWLIRAGLKCEGTVDLKCESKVGGRRLPQIFDATRWGDGAIPLAIVTRRG